MKGDFTLQAEAYGRSRPGYPSELINVLLADAGVGAGDPVVDLGAGTGILTRQLVERGLVVTAVEPNAVMRRRADHSSAQWIDGSFEESGLPSASQKWAVAAQAFHWADPAKALLEIHRILQPRFWFTVLWNVRAMNANAVLAWTAAAVERHSPGFRDAYDGIDWPTVLESTGEFQFEGIRKLRHVEPMSTARFVDLWRSHHWLQHSTPPEAFDAFLAELESHLVSIDAHEIDVVYDCTAWSARRRD